MNLERWFAIFFMASLVLVVSNMLPRSRCVLAQTSSIAKDRELSRELFFEGKYEQEIEVRNKLIAQAKDVHAIAGEKAYVAAAEAALALSAEERARITHARMRLATAYFLVKDGKFDRALDFFTEALDTHSAILKDDIFSIECHKSIAASSMMLDDFSTAKPHLAQAIANASRLLGDSHPYIAELHVELALLHLQLGQLKEAANCLQKARISMTALGLEEQYMFGRMQLLEAKLFNELGRHEEAQLQAKLASSVLAVAGKEWEINLAVAQGELGRAYEKSKKYPQSHSAFKRCVDIFNRQNQKVASNQTQLAILESYHTTLVNLNFLKDADTAREQIEAVKQRIEKQRDRSDH